MAAEGMTSDRVALTLYVSGASPESAAAVDTLSRLCAAEMPGQVDLNVVDVRNELELAVRCQILAIPTLIRWLPLPVRRLVGNLNDIQRLRTGLGLNATVAASAQTIDGEAEGCPARS